MGRKQTRNKQDAMFAAKAAMLAENTASTAPATEGFLQSTFNSVSNFFSNAYDTVTNTIEDAENSVANSIASVIPESVKQAYSDVIQSDFYKTASAGLEIMKSPVTVMTAAQKVLQPEKPQTTLQPIAEAETLEAPLKDALENAPHVTAVNNNGQISLEELNNVSFQQDATGQEKNIDIDNTENNVVQGDFKPSADKPENYATHTIQKGNTLTSIVKEHYGIENDGMAHRAALIIAKTNDISNPNKIGIGQSVNLPDMKAMQNATGSDTLRLQNFGQHLDQVASLTQNAMNGLSTQDNSFEGIQAPTSRVAALGMAS